MIQSWENLVTDGQTKAYYRRHWGHEYVFRAHVLKSILFSCTPPKQMLFLIISNENVFFQNSQGTKIRCNSRTRQRSRMGSADRQTDRQTETHTDTDRQTDWQTDESDFIGQCPTNFERPTRIHAYWNTVSFRRNLTNLKKNNSDQLRKTKRLLIWEKQKSFFLNYPQSHFTSQMTKRYGKSMGSLQNLGCVWACQATAN